MTPVLLYDVISDYSTIHAYVFQVASFHLFVVSVFVSSMTLMFPTHFIPFDHAFNILFSSPLLINQSKKSQMYYAYFFFQNFQKTPSYTS
jgi:hypothetical protein